MPDHPALAVLIGLPTARQLFPGTPSEVFNSAQKGRGRGLTFGAAFRAATAYWSPKAKAAQSARFSILAHARWKARRATAAEAGLAHLQAVIERELAVLSDTSLPHPVGVGSTASERRL
jgi:hypothetical protein